MNLAVSGVHTLFIPSASANSFIASKFVREIARFGGDVSSMVPEGGRRSGCKEKYEPVTDHDDPTQDDPASDRRRRSTPSQLLRRVVDIIAARPMPLSSSVMINRDEVLELVEDALARLPEELRAARWLLKEREEFLAKVQREGDDILDAARARAERMVQRTEVVRAAQHTRAPARRRRRDRGPPPAPRGRGLLRPASWRSSRSSSTAPMKTVQAGRGPAAPDAARRRAPGRARYEEPGDLYDAGTEEQ